MPETHARRALSGRELSFTVLAPLGSWLGRGTLRVLRVRESAGCIELVTGYEAYERNDP
ncbi:MAG: hypothetical protein M3Z07_02645 [Candidatus Eremiobacteraeota bacterium]|nr:hypothetical protein [Candidatus Eremiobacteraeota bacterium]